MLDYGVMESLLFSPQCASAILQVEDCRDDCVILCQIIIFLLEQLSVIYQFSTILK